jgi:hypothetical protein
VLSHLNSVRHRAQAPTVSVDHADLVQHQHLHLQELRDLRVGELREVHPRLELTIEFLKTATTLIE